MKDGDKIVTSNISSVFLPGLLVGYAADITNDTNNVTKSGYLIPAAEFDSLQEVLVITKLKSDMMKEESSSAPQPESASTETSSAETQAAESASQ